MYELFRREATSKWSTLAHSDNHLLLVYISYVFVNNIVGNQLVTLLNNANQNQKPISTVTMFASCNTSSTVSYFGRL